MILLNGVDVLNPEIWVLEQDKDNFVAELHHLVGCPIGVNLEPVDPNAKMLEDRLDITKGRTLCLDTVKRIEEVGFDYVCLTGNPGTGVTNEQIEEAIKLTKQYFSTMVIAEKMHGAGSCGPVTDLQTVKKFLEAGADVILVPAVGTIPGFDDADLKEIVRAVHGCDGKSNAMEAIQAAKKGDFILADSKMKAAGESLLKAHHAQTDMLSQEASGTPTVLSLLMIHGQDHLMTGIAFKDLAAEIVDLYRTISISK